MRGNFACAASCLLTLTVLTAVVFFPDAALAQQKPAASEGKASFVKYCAVCHGVDGKGNGPYAHLLKEKPANLTQLAKINNGRFPYEWVALIIDGRDARPSHGPGDMPVWGQRFAQSEGPADVHERIQGLVQYISTIQQK